MIAREEEEAIQVQTIPIPEHLKVCFMGGGERLRVF